QVQAQRAQAEAAIARAEVMAARMRQAERGGFPGMAGNQMVLVDGKAKKRPTHYAGSVRVRSLDPVPAQGGQEAPLNVHLEVSTEPRLQMQAITSTRITKAADDNGQSLTQETPGEDAQEGVVVAPGGARAFVLRRARMMAGPYGMGGPGH